MATSVVGAEAELPVEGDEGEELGEVTMLMVVW